LLEEDESGAKASKGSHEANVKICESAEKTAHRMEATYPGPANPSIKIPGMAP
jgi:hypothetical protein